MSSAHSYLAEARSASRSKIGLGEVCTEGSRPTWAGPFGASRWLTDHSDHHRSISPFLECGVWANKSRGALRTDREEQMHGGTEGKRRVTCRPETCFASACASLRLKKTATTPGSPPAGLRLLIYGSVGWGWSAYSTVHVSECRLRGPFLHFPRDYSKLASVFRFDTLNIRVGVSKNRDDLALLNWTLLWHFSLLQQPTSSDSSRSLNSPWNARSNISVNYDLSDDIFRGVNLI